MNTFPDENYTSLPDASGTPNTGGGWDTSFSGLSFQPFDKEVADILLKEVTPAEIEVKPGKLPIRFTSSRKTSSRKTGFCTCLRFDIDAV